jgi:endo-1,4-beta-xylanase
VKEPIRLFVNKAQRTTVVFVLLLAQGGGCLAQSLREYADRAGVLVGAAVNPALLKEEAYASTLAREFNMVEPENAMKWAAVRPTRTAFNFGPGDRLVAFAREHGMKVRGHCLAWAKYNPAWLSKGSFTPGELSRLLREHITTVMRHYAGQVFAWDVVNEAFDARGGVEHSVWYDAPGVGLKGRGTAYIEQAFRWAREADPKALLFYNDYDAEAVNAKSDAVYAMVKDFKSRGVPIDGVGLQTHVFDLSTEGIASMEANIERLTALGVQVQVTEMDVGLPLGADGRPANRADLARQADIYRFAASACLRQPGCTAFQTWGFTDKYTWIPGYTKGAKGEPLPFDRAYAPKPAYESLLDVFRRRAASARAPSAPAAVNFLRSTLK